MSTNNRSYQRSANTAQHLALSQMRAAETGRPVLHASISGITAVIDPDGDVHHETGLFERAIVSASVPTSTGETLYVRFGDWVVLLARDRDAGGDGGGDPPPGRDAVTVDQQPDRGDEPDHHDQARAARARGAAADGRAELRADAPSRPR